MRVNLFAAIPLIAVASAFAEPAFDITLDQSASTVSATLTVQGQSDSDTSAVSGRFRVRLDSAGSPQSIELHDFMLTIVDPLNFNIVFRVFNIPIGSIVVAASDVAVDYASPGVIQGPVPLIAGEFSFSDVPANSSGMASYTATGTVCTLLQAQTPPQPCNGMLDLSETGTQTASALPGELTIVGRTASLSGTISISGPLDPENPDLGSLLIAGSFVGSGQIPFCPGDFDQNGNVAVPDIFAFLSAWFAGLPSADLDGIPGVAVPDIFAFLSDWFAPCN